MLPDLGSSGSHLAQVFSGNGCREKEVAVPTARGRNMPG